MVIFQEYLQTILIQLSLFSGILIWRIAEISPKIERKTN